MGILKNSAVVAGILAAAGAAETLYFYNRTMKRKNADVERTVKMAGTDWSQYADILSERKAFMLAQPHEEVSQISFDGLKLCGSYFPPVTQTKGKKKLVICFHGYTSKRMSDFIGLTDYYFRKGYAMLHPDARAHGESEGTYIGFGCLDRRDALGWIQWALEHCGEDVDIILHGISMGGATVLMASGLELPPQVKGIISDCAFTSPSEVFSHVLKHMYHLPAFPVIPAADWLNRRLAGYGMDECNAKREVETSTCPVLLIHGSADTFVPVEMCYEIYEHCNAPKQRRIIEGAAHAESYFKDMAAYEEALDNFLGED